MPERFNCASSSLKPKGSMRWSSVRVAAQRRAMLPVLGGISGSTRTMCIRLPALVVEDLPEDESVSRSRHPSFTTIPGMQHFFQITRGKFSAANLRERPDNSAAHFVEEAVAFDRESEQRTFALNLTARQRAHRGF